MRRLPFLPLILAPLLALAPGCATYEQELQRADEHFQHDEHEKTLATLRALELDWPSLSTRDRARYCYLRGMTDYRIGFKADARHWLAIAHQIEVDAPGALVGTEKSLVKEKLGELNQIVWAGDVLPTEEPPGARSPKKVETTGDDKADDKADDKGKGKAKGKDDEDDAPKPKKKTKKTEE